MDQLRRELEAYYNQWRGARWTQLTAEDLAVRREILAAMDVYAAGHPDEHPSLLKSRLHEEMVERFVPVIFPHSPFFFEMGLRFAENWGNPGPPEMVVGSWLQHRRNHIALGKPEWQCIRAFTVFADSKLPMWNVWSGFDVDHHCIGYTTIFRGGVNGRLAAIAARQLEPCTVDEAANLEAMARSCRALLRVASRFREHARQMRTSETDPQVCRFLDMIIEAAGRVPAEPPRSFYEGLAMLWFLRETTATLDAIGISVIGHLDRLLYPLYAADIDAGRLTESEALDLLSRWMLPTDIKFHVADGAWPETSTCMELGGCNETGQPIWNDVTRLVITTHHQLRLLNPKPNCRYGSNSPKAYLDLISSTMLAGHNHFALLNDDVLIPTFVKAGKTLAEARLYVNGGCQEPMAEGVEHTAGAYFYYCLTRILDLGLQPPTTLPEELTREARAAIPPPLPDASTFEELYSAFRDSVLRTLHTGTEWAITVGREQWQIHPCPLLSATLEGCIANGRDYTRGGAKYNPSGVALIGLGTTIDSLYAIKCAVYDEGWLTLSDLRAALTSNWEGFEALRLRLRRLPKFGQGHLELDELAARFSRELAAAIRTFPNERGGNFQASFFVYYAFDWFAKSVRATPDGRWAGDLLSQGIGPARTTPATLSEICETLGRIDFLDHPGNAVLDAQLPAGRISTEALTASLRTFAQLGGPTIQINCVSVDQLRDAQRHPERHRDLTVRICGLSAYFVNLTPNIQDEIISRSLVEF